MPYILISLVVLIGGIFGAANYMTLGQLNALNFNHPIGTSLTTITSATKISDLATILPANFNALNDGKIENSSSSIAAITTLQNLTSVGTIATGVWSGTAINVNKGGTGSTTLAQYQVLLGSSTNAIGVVSGYGSSGQFLTSAGSGAPPTWTTSALSLSDNYAWTGEHIFNASTSMVATTTFVGRITSNTASTTVYNDLKIMSEFSAPTIYGGKYPCLGQITGTTGTPGWSATSITCGFPAKQVQLFGIMQSVPAIARSFGISDGTNHYVNAFWSIETAATGYISATSSLNLIYRNSSSIGEVYASTTMTTTGFNLNKLLVGATAVGYTILYIAQ